MFGKTAVLRGLEKRLQKTPLVAFVSNLLFIYLFLFSLYLELTFPSLQLKPINVN